MLFKVYGVEFWKLFLPEFVASYSWPNWFVWCTKKFEDFEKLIDLWISTQEYRSGHKFVENTSNWPWIYSKGIFLCSKQDFRSSIPESDYFMCVWFRGKTVDSCKSKISYSNLIMRFRVKNVIWFEVSMKNSLWMAVSNSWEKLIHDWLDLFVFQGFSVFNERLEVCADIIKNKLKPILSTNNISQLHNIRMIELFKKRNFPHSCRRNAFFVIINKDLLHCNKVLC